MRADYFIIVVAAMAVGVVLLAAHPNRDVALARVSRRVRAMLPSVGQVSWRRFWFGAAATAFVFAVLNLLPYLLTRHEPEHCGLQIMGFPFTFRS